MHLEYATIPISIIYLYSNKVLFGGMLGGKEIVSNFKIQ
jgi:hypothetical protein